MAGACVTLPMLQHSNAQLSLISMSALMVPSKKHANCTCDLHAQPASHAHAPGMLFLHALSLLANANKKN